MDEATMKLLLCLLLSSWFSSIYGAEGEILEEMTKEDLDLIGEELTRSEEDGPSKEELQEMADAMAALMLRRAKFARRESANRTEEPIDMDNYRAMLGPKDENLTLAEKAEQASVLRHITLEGDMIPNAQQIDFLNTGEEEGRKKRALLVDTRYYWNINNPILFNIDSSLSYAQNTVRQSVRFWMDNTCINFQESNTGSNRLRFYRGSGCWSYIGKQPWTSQDVSIGSGCESMGTITHEIGHALGFYHTQARYDRDNYLTINYANIQASQVYNFQKLTSASENHFNMAYDFGSVMQYPPYAFAINTRIPTNVARNVLYQNMMGQREGPAFSDIKMINRVYNCARRCSNTINCQNMGFVNSRTCNSCLCPRQFSGPYCTEVGRGTAAKCNGRVLEATSTTWTTFAATVGMSTPTSLAQPVTCYWHVTAPAGRKVQIQVRNVNTSCQESCYWGGFEINLGNWENSGMLTCCNSISSNVFTSTGTTITIRGTTRYSDAAMNFQYRLV